MNFILTLKYKLFLILVMVPTIILGAFLFFSMQEYHKDKIAYIFDSNLSLTRSFSSQVEIEVEKAKLLINQYDHDSSTKKSLLNTERLKSSVIFSSSNTGSINFEVYNKEDFNFKSKLQLKSFFAKNINHLSEKELIVIIDKNEKIWILKKSAYFNTRYIAFAQDFTKLREIFSTKGQVNKAIVNFEGKNIFESFEDKENSKAKEFIHWKSNFSQSSGGLEVDDLSGVKYIVSYSKINKYGLNVISYLPKDVSLMAIQELKTKSFFLFGSLNFLAIIITLFAVSRVTGQINSITSVVDRISKGDLSAVVPVTTNDETGILASSINKMTGDIRSLIEERNEYIKKLKNTQQQLIDTERLAIIGEMSATFAHEISNPVTILRISYDQLLKKNKDDFSEDVLKKLGRFKAGVDGLMTICENLKKFVHQGQATNEVSEQFEDIEINQLVKDSFSFLNPILIRDHITSNINEIDDHMIKINKGMVQQVIVNIVKNAVEAMVEANIVVPKVNVDIKEIHGTKGIKIYITDNGPGIPKDILKNLFEAFFTTKAKGVGTGLGLSVSKKILEDHGGSLTAESKLGEGTTFILTFPNIAQVERSDTVAKVSPLLYTGDTVLIVEDEPVIREYLIELIKSMGYQTISAEDGKKGLALYKQHKPKIIFTDFDLPIMDGVEFSLKVRNIDPDIPIIGLTGSMMLFRSRDLSHLTDILEKPISDDAILDYFKKKLAA